jgi:tRNA pseudouridine65 synthase
MTLPPDAMGSPPTLPSSQAPEPAAIPPGITLLYVDEHVVVAAKPSGLLVHRGWADDDDVAMFRVRDALGGAHVHPVHRLDRGTSGALLFARNREAAAALSRSFEAGRVDKRYLALVRGTPPAEGLIDYAIPRAEDGPRVEARTRFRLIRRSPVDRCSLVVAMPETGRLHQIRRHLRHVNHPLIGDVTYGSGSINRHYRAVYNFFRLGLHACRLAFEHPVTGTRVVVEAPVPDDLRATLEQLALPTEAPTELDLATPLELAPAPTAAEEPSA